MHEKEFKNHFQRTESLPVQQGRLFLCEAGFKSRKLKIPASKNGSIA